MGRWVRQVSKPETAIAGGEPRLENAMLSYGHQGPVPNAGAGERGWLHRSPRHRLIHLAVLPLSAGVHGEGPRERKAEQGGRPRRLLRVRC